MIEDILSICNILPYLCMVYEFNSLTGGYVHPCVSSQTYSEQISPKFGIGDLD